MAVILPAGSAEQTDGDVAHGGNRTHAARTGKSAEGHSRGTENGRHAAARTLDGRVGPVQDGPIFAQIERVSGRGGCLSTFVYCKSRYFSK